MITTEWLLVARGASLDRESNSLTVFSILTGIAADAFPLLIQQIVIVALMRRSSSSDPEKGSATLTISHSGKQLFQNDFTYDFGGKKNNQLTLNLHGFVVPSPGEMTFALSRRGKVLREYSIDFDTLGAGVSISQPSPQASAITTAKASGKAKRKNTVTHRKRAK